MKALRVDFKNSLLQKITMGDFKISFYEGDNEIQKCYLLNQ